MVEAIGLLRLPHRLTYPVFAVVAVAAGLVAYLGMEEPAVASAGALAAQPVSGALFGLAAGMVASWMGYRFGRKVDVLEDTCWRDPATGLANRRCFELRFSKEACQARQAGTPLALLVIDVDRLKETNDRYGHLAGDAVIRVVANSLALSCRRTDLAARYGGDEFVVMSPTTSAVEAVQLARRIQANLKVLATDGACPERTASVSIGIADLSATGSTDLGALFAAADRALYRAKGDRDHGAGLALAEN